VSRSTVVLPLLLVLCGGLAAQDAAPTRRPNVLFLVADDLCAGVLGCYGGRDAHTPNLDRLAARGVRFDRAYCQFPVCGPSRAATMSGMYPASLGVLGNGGAHRIVELLGDRPSLPQWFRQQGWFSARVSKIYHMRVPGDITAGVDGPDHPASWELAVNCKAPEWYTEGEAENLASGGRLRFEREKHYGLGFGTAFYVVKGASDGAEQADHQAATEAIRILEARRDDARPFFLAVGFVRPHVPLVAPEEWFERHDPAAVALPQRVAGDLDDIPKAGMSLNSRRLKIEGDDDRQREIIAAYRAATSFMDAQVGRVLDVLEELDLADDTLVVFSSDHGYHLGEHGFWQKLSLHEESARIPLLLAGPGVPSGASRSGLAQQIDLYPTLTELAGLEVPAHVEGRSLLPLLRDPDAVVHEAVFSRNGKGRLVRTARWALLQWQDGTAELYDMRDDPQQYVNRIVGRLRGTSDRAWLSRLGDLAIHEAAGRAERARTSDGLEGGTTRPGQIVPPVAHSADVGEAVHRQRGHVAGRIATAAAEGLERAGDLAGAHRCDRRGQVAPVDPRAVVLAAARIAAAVRVDADRLAGLLVDDRRAGIATGGVGAVAEGVRARGADARTDVGLLHRVPGHRHRR
jgi:iduronate 2-sulfatase